MSLMTRKYELPDWLSRSATDPGQDPAAEEKRAMAMLSEVGPLILSCVSSDLSTWLRMRSTEVAAAWLGEVSVEASTDIGAAADAATQRVSDELQEFLALDPSLQSTTPQSILRGCHVEPGQALSALGVPEVEREEFEARSLPGDKWSLAPSDLGQISESLGPLLLAWGLAKARALRARSANG
ncbi:unannotated protein [freshwater metagenome]|uniref:Unannotated protein n=1 Tax=freshwater metagenome TaxID=449393 RepID=A0A6J6L8M1_9ZZZZ